MKLDKTDIKILAELQRNGRIPNTELAEIVNLSPSPCLLRMKRLYAEGFISGYSAHINLSKLGPSVTIFTEVTLKSHRQIDFERFLRSVSRVPSITECHFISGGYDYLLKFVTKDISEFQETIERLAEMDIGIDKYQCFVVLKSPILKPSVPVDFIASRELN